jgi:hypothetical protein
VLTVYRRHPPVVAIGDIENDEANRMRLQSVLRLKLQLSLAMVGFATGNIENDEANTMGFQSVLRLKLQLSLVMVLLLESGNIENDRNK